MIYPPEHMGRAQFQFGDAGISTATPVPSRYSSAMWPYWADPDTLMAHKVSNEADTLNTSAEEDPYTKALRQMTATHSPSLDNLPLDRSIAIAPRSIPSDEALQQSPQTSAAGARAEGSGSQPRATGRQYHRLGDGRVYVEVVDVSAHQNRGHSSVNKVRPATGIRPFTAVPDTGSTAASSVYSEAGNDTPTSPVVLLASSGGGAQGGREGRERKWGFLWHIRS